MMGLNIAIGVLAALLAVLGGIVSAHPPTDVRHKRGFVAAFFLCGFVAIILIIVQALKTERAATQADERQKQMVQKQNELIDKVNSESRDLGDTKQMLEQSRIDQASMRGQLDAFELVAGRIGQNSGAGNVGWSPGLRQAVKTLPAVRWNSIVQRGAGAARWQAAGEAEAGSAGVQPAKE